MKNEHITAWTTALRNPTLRQENGVLARVRYGARGYCCLGVGCVVAGIPWVNNGPKYATGYTVAFEGEIVFPPRSFREWLGMTVAPDSGSSDIWPDWGDLKDYSGEPYDEMACSHLNDDLDMTFEQIADVLDYFGVRA